MKRIHSLLIICALIICSGAIFSSCSDDDDNDMTKIKVQVAIRVDNHVPPTVTVFGHDIPLTHKEWIITQEAYRQYESEFSVEKSKIKYVPSGPFSSLSETAEGIITVNSVQGKRDFSVQTETNGNHYLFVLK